MASLLKEDNIERELLTEVTEMAKKNRNMNLKNKKEELKNM